MPEVGRLISPVVLDFLWEEQRAGELPYPLEVRSHGHTMEERAGLRRQVHQQLRDQGLLDPTGRLESGLAGWLGALAEPAVSIDAVFLPELDQPAIAALAVLSGSAAVLAVQQAGGLRLRGVHTDGLVSAIVRLLPAHPRGTEQSVTLPAGEFAEISGVRHAREPAGGGSPASVRDRQAIARFAALPSLRGGQFAVNCRTSVAGKRRSPVLAWFDNQTGRYLCQSTVASDGVEWVTIAPADPATLRRRIAEMMAAVTRDAR